MKIKCADCGLEIEKSKEDVQKLRALSKTGKVMPNNILKLLDIYEGPCGEESEHTFSWNLEFLKQVEELKGKHKGLLGKMKSDKETLDKVDKEIEDLKKKLEDAENIARSIGKGLIKINEEMPVVISSFEEITGTRDLGEWK